jgi:hypothetical protein
MDFSKVKQWNSGQYPVTINNIRFNQDYTLLTLATSRGYKIFSSKTLLQVQEETELVRDFGNLNIVMTYYSSNIVFFTAKKNNPKITQKQLIIFDDFSQNEISHFTSNDDNIIDFYVSKNAIFIGLQNKIVILELLSMKIINIIENVEINYKLLSYNNYNNIAYTQQNMKQKIFVEFLFFKNHAINRTEKKCIKMSFDYAQLIEISPSGNYIAVVSLLGNILHIYNIANNKLIECILIGTKVYNIENLSFKNKKENYVLINLNKKKIYVYKIDKKNINQGINKNYLEDAKCVCSKYTDDDIIAGRIKLDNNFGIFNNFLATKNHDIKKSHLSIDVPNTIIFTEFFSIFNKSFIIIDKSGYLYIYFFKKEKTDKLPPYHYCKWI